MPADHRALGGGGNSAQADADRQRLEGLRTFQNLRTREVVAAMMPPLLTLRNESALGWAKAEGADFVRMLFQPHRKGFNYAFLLSQI